MPDAMTEFDLHIFVAELMRKAGRRDVIFAHVPNGEARNAVTGAKLKRMGVRPGFPDFIFILPPHGRAAFLELKTEKGRLSQTQKTFETDAEQCGAYYAVARSPGEVEGILQAWQVLRLSQFERFGAVA